MHYIYTHYVYIHTLYCTLYSTISIYSGYIYTHTHALHTHIYIYTPLWKGLLPFPLVTPESTIPDCKKWKRSHHQNDLKDPCLLTKWNPQQQDVFLPRNGPRQRYGVQHQKTTARPPLALVPYGPQEHAGCARVHMQSHQGNTGVDKSHTHTSQLYIHVYTIYTLCIYTRCIPWKYTLCKYIKIYTIYPYGHYIYIYTRYMYTLHTHIYIYICTIYIPNTYLYIYL